MCFVSKITIKVIFSECHEALSRLTEMIQGIGNPLVAVYARCYLCRVGLSVSPVDAKFLLRNFECFLETYQHVSVMLVTVYNPVFIWFPRDIVV